MLQVQELEFSKNRRKQKKRLVYARVPTAIPPTPSSTSSRRYVVLKPGKKDHHDWTCRSCTKLSSNRIRNGRVQKHKKVVNPKWKKNGNSFVPAPWQNHLDGCEQLTEEQKDAEILLNCKDDEEMENHDEADEQLIADEVEIYHDVDEEMIAVPQEEMDLRLNGIEGIENGSTAGAGLHIDQLENAAINATQYDFDDEYNEFVDAREDVIAVRDSLGLDHEDKEGNSFDIARNIDGFNSENHMGRSPGTASRDHLVAVNIGAHLFEEETEQSGNRHIEDEKLVDRSVRIVDANDEGVGEENGNVPVINGNDGGEGANDGDDGIRDATEGHSFDLDGFNSANYMGRSTPFSSREHSLAPGPVIAEESVIPQAVQMVPPRAALLPVAPAAVQFGPRDPGENSAMADDSDVDPFGLNSWLLGSSYRMVPGPVDEDGPSFPLAGDSALSTDYNGDDEEGYEYGPAPPVSDASTSASSVEIDENDVAAAPPIPAPANQGDDDDNDSDHDQNDPIPHVSFWDQF